MNTICFATVKGQHSIESLKFVVESLKTVEADGREYDDIVKKLVVLGRVASRRYFILRRNRVYKEENKWIVLILKKRYEMHLRKEIVLK